MKSFHMYLYLRKTGAGRLQSLNSTRRAAFFNGWINDDSHFLNRFDRIRYARKKMRDGRKCKY